VEKKITFHINNLAYSINIDSSLEAELVKFLPVDRNIDTQELLLAYIRKTQEFVNFKYEIEKISDKLPLL